MLKRFLVLFSLSCQLVSAADGPRHPAVQRILDAHAGVLQGACDLFLNEFGHEWLTHQAPVPLSRASRDARPARETTLVSSSLGMVDAVGQMVGLSFPLQPGCIDAVLEAVVGQVASLGSCVVERRALSRSLLRAAGRMLSPLTRDLQLLVNDFARPISGNVHFGLVECLVRVCAWPHQDLVDVLIFGFQVLGRIPFCGVHRPVDEPSTAQFSRESNVQSFDDAVRHLTERARRAALDPSAMADLESIWDLAIGECERDLCVGPKSRGDVERMFLGSPFGPRCIPSFAVWQKGKCRRIDDALRSGHNALIYMVETIVCETADLPARVAAAFARRLGLNVLDLRLGTDDIASAYRILVSKEPHYTIAALWCPASRGEPGVRYFVLRGFNFGLKCAPLHLATLMNPLVDFARKIGLVPCGKFYDDVVTVDLACGGSSAQGTLAFLFALLGFPFAPGKHERLRSSNAFLGVVTDFSHAVAGYVLLRVKEKRRRRLLAELRDVRGSGKLSPAHAARLRGKLYFTTCTAYFGVGRPALHAFTARQYTKYSGRNSFALNDDLICAIDFFIDLLQRLPPYRYQLKPDAIRPLYVWSDAMWEALKDDSGGLVSVLDEETGHLFYLGKAVIAFLCFDPSDSTWHTSHCHIGIDVIRQLVPGKKTYIGQLESLAAAFVLETLPADRLQGRSAIFWIDNLSAKYGLQKGYSRVEDSGRIINSFKIKQASLQLRSWFEYVPSEQNVADLPSRGAFDRMFEVIDAVMGAEWICFTYSAVLPKFSTWLAPLASIPKRARTRSGSRGGKRRRAGLSGVAAEGASTSL